MAEKILNTRIGLKYDTLENWSKTENQFILKKGEVAFATVSATAGTGLTEPVIMAKIGDGTNTFNGLGWDFYAKAADVYGWAKKAAPDWNDFSVIPENRLPTIAIDTDTHYSFEIPTEGEDKGKLVVKSTLYTKGVAGNSEKVGAYDFITPDELTTILANYYTKEEADARFQPVGDYKTIQTAVTDPTANGSALAFIDSISQDTNGVITATKKNVDLSNYATKSEIRTDDEIKTIAAAEIEALIKASDDTNADVVIENINSLVDYVNKNAGDIAQLVTDVNAANTNASNAVATANDANTTAGQALEKANEALEGAEGAAASALAAKASEDAAKVSENNAKTSETNAGASAGAAAGSATLAGEKAEAAANSAFAAGNAQTAAELAQSKAEEAQNKAEKAYEDVTAAEGRITQSESNAAGYASAASGSAQVATDKATIATNKADAAAGSANAAAQSKADAEAILGQVTDAATGAQATANAANATAGEAKSIAEGAAAVAGEAKTASEAATQAVAGLHAIATSGSLYDGQEVSISEKESNVKYIIFDCGSATHLID